MKFYIATMILLPSTSAFGGTRGGSPATSVGGDPCNDEDMQSCMEGGMAGCRYWVDRITFVESCITTREYHMRMDDGFDSPPECYAMMPSECTQEGCEWSSHFDKCGASQTHPCENYNEEWCAAVDNCAVHEDNGMYESCGHY